MNLDKYEGNRRVILGIKLNRFDIESLIKLIDYQLKEDGYKDLTRRGTLKRIKSRLQLTAGFNTFAGVHGSIGGMELEKYKPCNEEGYVRTTSPDDNGVYDLYYNGNVIESDKGIKVVEIVEKVDGHGLHTLQGLYEVVGDVGVVVERYTFDLNFEMNTFKTCSYLNFAVPKDEVRLLINIIRENIASKNEIVEDYRFKFRSLHTKLRDLEGIYNKYENLDIEKLRSLRDVLLVSKTLNPTYDAPQGWTYDFCGFTLMGVEEV